MCEHPDGLVYRNAGDMSGICAICHYCCYHTFESTQDARILLYSNNASALFSHHVNIASRNDCHRQMNCLFEGEILGGFSSTLLLMQSKYRETRAIHHFN